MVNKNHILRILVTFILISIHPVPALASEYACTIKAVLELNDIGLYKSHGWVANYMNRKFFVNRESGKVIGTTALKARLTNFNKTSSPKVLHNTNEKSSYKAVTIIEDKGQFSSLRIYENVESDEKPYSYQTAVGMLLTGTCIEDKSKQ
ncbi:MAG: hypothetical protein ACI9ZT_001909 [Gammaproteobacteria bacterium]|jgi:hypothetical protein